MSEQAMTPPEAAIEAKRLEAKREKARRLQEKLRGRLEEPKGTMPPATFQNIMRAAVNADRKGDEESARALVEMARRLRGGTQAAEEAVTASWQDAPIVNSSGSWRDAPIVGGEAPPPVADPPAEPGDIGGMSAAGLDGAMFGFGDEYLAGISAVLGVQPDGQGGADWFQYDRPIGERYDTALGAIRQEQAQFSDANPGKALGAEIAGSIIGPGKGASSFVRGAATTGGRIARGAAVGGGSAAGFGFGEGEGGATERAISGAKQAPIGLAAGGVLASIGQGFGRAVEALSKRGQASESIPTVQALKQAAQKAYTAAEESNAFVPSRRVQALGRFASGKLRSVGYDRQLHPRVGAVLDRISSETGPKSIAEMEIIRRVATNAAQSAQPDERRLAGILIDQIDNVIDRMGDKSSKARQLWAQARRLETIEDLIERASTFDNFERALQSQFRILLRNRKRLRGFSGKEIAAIRKVANGSTPQRALASLANLLNVRGVSGASVAGAATYSGGALGAVPPIVGYGAGRAAQSMVRQSADDARRVIATGVERPIPRNALAPVIPGVGAVISTGRRD